MGNDFLKRLLAELSDLNDVPKFQLERAISPLLGIFIKEIIDKIFNTNVSSPFPEFPLKKEKNKQSTNIDWLLFDEQSKTIFFVELKTDTFSYNVNQSKIYKGIKTKINNEGAAFLLTELNTIKVKSNRQEKYAVIIKKFPISEDNLKDYKILKIIYIAPLPPYNPNRYYYDKIILFQDLPNKLTTDFHSEWLQLKEFLEMITTQAYKIKRHIPEKNQEGNIAVFKDLGIYSEDPEEDRKINEKLIKFLESQGYKMPEIKIIKDKD